MPSEPKDYYILDGRSCVGNCALWWTPGGRGYTCNLEEAGLFTRTRAYSGRDIDIPVHRSVARSCAVTHVRWDHLRQAGVNPNMKEGEASDA